jgi:molecular chaperone GrpE
MTDKKAEAQTNKTEETHAQAKKQEKTAAIKASEHEALLKEAKEYKDKYLRLYAEFENARKRMDRDKAEFVKYANEGLIVEFLNILDDLERSVKAAHQKHEDYQAFLKGIEMVMTHVYGLLKKNDVRPIESIGKAFDPDCHEALMQEENDELNEGTVIEEFQKGYMLGERVVRTAKVKVAKKKM